MVSRSTKRTILAVLGGAMLYGFFHALPYVGVRVQAPIVMAAARGIANERGVMGLGQARGDGFYGWLWQVTGEGGLAAAQWAGVFGKGLLEGLAVLAAAAVIAAFAGKRRRVSQLVLGAAAVVLAAGAGKSIWETARDWRMVREPVVLTRPTELLESARTVPAGQVFGSPSLLPYLVLWTPEASGKVDARMAREWCLNPSLWRQALREHHWTAVALAGPTSEYAPLLEHLLTSPDWRLSRVSNEGYFFVREAGPAAGMFAAGEFHLGTKRETAVYLAQIAERYDALHREVEARSAMTQALKLAPRDAEVLVHAASLEASHKRWPEALEACERALQADPRSSYAKLLKAMALLEIGQPTKAEESARAVLAQAPNDPYTLFLYARICRQLQDFDGEAGSLEKLVAQSKAAGEVPPGYYVYLGQAYAKLGEADKAVANYRMALQAPKMDPQFATEVRNAIGTIEANKGQ